MSHRFNGIITLLQLFGKGIVQNRREWTGIECTCRNILHFVPLVWHGSYTGNNLLPLREQILSCKGAISGSES